MARKAWVDSSESNPLDLSDGQASGTAMEEKPMYSVVLAACDPILRQTYTHFLEEANVEVFAARNGDEAYRLCESTHPDLVIACMHLRANGVSERPLIDVLHEAFPEVPVLAMATSENEATANQAYRMGASCLLRESADGEYLLSVVENIVVASAGIRQDGLVTSETSAATVTIG